MSRTRRWTDTDLRDAVASSHSRGEVIQKLGLSLCAGNYPRIGREITRMGLDVSHMSRKGIPSNRVLDIEYALVRNSTYTSSHHLKHRLLALGRLANHCVLCGAQPQWNGLPLVLVLDHINGDNRDNRITNLRLLCPNCNSQQPTFAGRNKRKKP